MRKEDFSIDSTFDPCWFSLDYTFKRQSRQILDYILGSRKLNQYFL